MYLLYVTGALPPVGFPIRKSPGQSLFSGSPKLIAAYHVLHRLSLPRHPPYALSSLTIKKLLYNQFYPFVLPTITPRNSGPGLLRFTTFDSRFAASTPTTNHLCNCQRTLYRRILFARTNLVEVNGFEPMTPCVQGRCSPS